jgi:hypothetical protein
MSNDVHNAHSYVGEIPFVLVSPPGAAEAGDYEADFDDAALDEDIAETKVVEMGKRSVVAKKKGKRKTPLTRDEESSLISRLHQQRTTPAEPKLTQLNHNLVFAPLVNSLSARLQAAAPSISERLALQVSEYNKRRAQDLSGAGAITEGVHTFEPSVIGHAYAGRRRHVKVLKKKLATTTLSVSSHGRACLGGEGAAKPVYASIESSASKASTSSSSSFSQAQSSSQESRSSPSSSFLSSSSNSWLPVNQRMDADVAARQAAARRRASCRLHPFVPALAVSRSSMAALRSKPALPLRRRHRLAAVAMTDQSASTADDTPSVTQPTAAAKQATTTTPAKLKAGGRSRRLIRPVSAPFFERLTAAAERRFATKTSARLTRAIASVDGCSFAPLLVAQHRRRYSSRKIASASATANAKEEPRQRPASAEAVSSSASFFARYETDLAQRAANCDQREAVASANAVAPLFVARRVFRSRQTAQPPPSRRMATKPVIRAATAKKKKAFIEEPEW